MKSIAAFVVTSVLAACSSQPEAPQAVSGQGEGESATVRHLQLEGGCWALETKSGRVQPIDLPEEYKQDGLKVKVVLRDAGGAMSVCQIGPMKRVERISRAR